MASRLGSVIARRLSSVQGSSAVAGEHSGGAKKWKILSFLVAVPGVLVCYANAFLLQDHHMKPDEFVPYEHLRLRSKRFPWGDGNHTLFHNKHMNPLPEGYEE